MSEEQYQGFILNTDEDVQEFLDSFGLTPAETNRPIELSRVNPEVKEKNAIEKLCTLAAKTTCKDRWRQILNEADRLRDEHKYLCTMQQGISATQMDEMRAEKVIVPY